MGWMDLERPFRGFDATEDGRVETTTPFYCLIKSEGGDGISMDVFWKIK